MFYLVEFFHNGLNLVYFVKYHKDMLFFDDKDVYK